MAKTVLIISRNVFSPRFGGAFNIRRQIAVIAQLGYRVSVVHDDPVAQPFAAEMTASGAVTFKQCAAFFDLSMKRYVRPERLRAHLAARREVEQLCNQLAPHAIMVHGERPLRFYLKLQRRGHRIYFCLHDSSLASRRSIREEWGDMWHSDESGIRRAALLLRRSIEVSRVRQFRYAVMNSRYLARAFGVPGAMILHPPVRPIVLRMAESLAVNDARRLNRIVFVGRLEAAKGPQDAVAMMAHLPANYELELIGDGVMRDELRRQAASLGVADRISLLGPLSNDQVLEHMASAGVLFVPSNVDEAFGIVGAEAMLCGTPVVAYDIGGIAEWCVPPAGVLVAPSDVRAAASAVVWMTRDPSRWAELSLAGLEHARKTFSEQRFESDIRRILEADE